MRFTIVPILVAKIHKPAACTVSDIRIQTDARQLTTDHDWLEHHAKRFSAAILMPIRRSGTYAKVILII